MTHEEFIAQIKTEIENNKTNRNVALRLHKVYEKGIVEETRNSMFGELSPTVYARAKDRVANINLIAQVADRTSRVYNKPATRKVEDPQAQEIIDWYRDQLHLDENMQEANKLLELNKQCFLEPYMGAKGPKIRVLTSYQGMAHSDSEEDVTQTTAFTKFLTPKTIKIKKHGISELVQVERFRTYTDAEIIDWDTNAGITSVITNPIGRIPFINVHSSKYTVSPSASIDDLESAVLVNKLYSDVFYAINYTCHSLFTARDCKLPDNPVFDPATIFVYSSANVGQDGSLTGPAGSVDILKPELDVDKILSLIEATTTALLETKGIKAGQSNQRLERPNAHASIIEQADTTAYITKRVTLFEGIEDALWDLIATLHNTLWIFDDRVKVKSRLNIDNLEVIFSEVKPVELRSELLANLEKAKEMRLTTRRRQLGEMYPSLTARQIDLILKDVEEEEAKENAVSSASTPVAQRQAAHRDREGDNPDDQTQDDPGN